ncbi:MAG TPA: hypothetical protein VFT49_03870 [Candidatus Saccharimonadales bacterium]|nr:hypothetical protein [Candidatus Saccharimonadales bacterium]
MTDWNQVLGWGSPIGLGVFLAGLGIFTRNYMRSWWDRRNK